MRASGIKPRGEATGAPQVARAGLGSAGVDDGAANLRTPDSASFLFNQIVDDGFTGASRGAVVVGFREHHRQMGFEQFCETELLTERRETERRAHGAHSRARATQN